MRARTALIAGASGLVGGHCLDLLLDDPAYRSVTALVRRELPKRHPKLTQRVADFDRLGDHADLFAVDDLFCCLGTTIAVAGSQEAFRRVDYEYPLALAGLAAGHGAGQFLIVTALGADPRSRVFYNRVKGEVEGAIAALAIPAIQIFRPSLLLGDRREVRLGERIGAAASKLITPLLLGPLRKYRPIEARTVARAMIAVAARHPGGVNIHESDRIEALVSGG